MKKVNAFSRNTSNAGFILKLCALIVCGVLFFSILIYASYARGYAQDISRTGLVIQFGNGTVITRCISFSQEDFTGLDLLNASGYPIIVSIEAQGVAVCKIADQGCPATDCFCDSPPNYWSYWHLVDNQWEYSPVASSNYPLEAGDVDGWTWGIGSPPPVFTLDQICTANQQTPTSTDTPIVVTLTPTISDTPAESPTPMQPTSPNIPTPTNAFSGQTTQQPLQTTRTSQPARTPNTTPTYPQPGQSQTSLASPASDLTQANQVQTSTPIPPFFVLPARRSRATQSPTAQIVALLPTSGTEATVFDQPMSPTEITTSEERNSQMLIGYFVFVILIIGLITIIIFQRRKKKQQNI